MEVLRFDYYIRKLEIKGITMDQWRHNDSFLRANEEAHTMLWELWKN